MREVRVTPRIDQLAGLKAAAIVETGGCHGAASQDDDVGGGAADVDEQRIGPFRRRPGRAGVPVRGGDAVPHAIHDIAAVETADIGPRRCKIEPRAVLAQYRAGFRTDRLDAILAAGEVLRKLPGHGDGVLFRSRIAVGGGFQRVAQVAYTEPQRARNLLDGHHAPVRHHCHFEMNAANIPADGGCHCYAPLQ